MSDVLQFDRIMNGHVGFHAAFTSLTRSTFIIKSALTGDTLKILHTRSYQDSSER